MLRTPQPRSDTASPELLDLRPEESASRPYVGGPRTRHVGHPAERQVGEHPSAILRSDATHALSGKKRPPTAAALRVVVDVRLSSRVRAALPAERLSMPMSASHARTFRAGRNPRRFSAYASCHSPQLSRGKSRAPLIDAPNSAPSSREVAETNSPTLRGSPCWAARQACAEKNCPVHDAEVGAAVAAAAGATTSPMARAVTRQAREIFRLIPDSPRARRATALSPYRCDGPMRPPAGKGVMSTRGPGGPRRHPDARR
jgi:hypothetical protein